MTEVTYNHFVAHLAEATAEVEARLRQWASGCEECSWVRDDNNRAALYFARAESRTTRQMQSLLRTLTSRWGLPLGKLEAGWLQALTADEYRAAVSAASAAESAEPHADAEPPQNAEHTIVPRHHASPCTEAAAQRAVLFSFSPDFDRRAREMYESLLVAQTAH